MPFFTRRTHITERAKALGDPEAPLLDRDEVVRRVKGVRDGKTEVERGLIGDRVSIVKGGKEIEGVCLGFPGINGPGSESQTALAIDQSKSDDKCRINVPIDYVQSIGRVTLVVSNPEW
jgi:sporulation protein YlmC with PRC-barrel domain